LIKDIMGFHPCMPSNNGWNVANLESIVNAGIKHDETSALNIYQRLIIMPLSCKGGVDGHLFNHH